MPRTTPPPLPVRVLILLVAVAALFCAVCARARPPAGPSAAPDAGRPEYFPATKAPAQMYQH